MNGFDVRDYEDGMNVLYHQESLEVQRMMEVYLGKKVKRDSCTTCYRYPNCRIYRECGDIGINCDEYYKEEEEEL
jgi:hypothetical protein